MDNAFNESLKCKKLLLIGGNAYAKGIKKYVDKTGVYLIAIGNVHDTPLKKIANESYNIDTRDIDAIVELVNDKKIDGMFAGASEDNILSAIAVSERTGVRFYVNREQWDLLADKKHFKTLATECGIPVPKSYKVTEEFFREDLDRIEYPVIVKPADGSGGKGMNSCYNEEELHEAFMVAMDNSHKKEVVVEQMIVDGEEVFFLYTISEGVCSLSASFTKQLLKHEDKHIILPIFHMYPSNHIEKYMDEVDQNMRKLINAAGIKNGVLTVQGFWKDDDFYFFELGYRMGGAQWYIFTDYFNGTNSLEYMLNYALVGEMGVNNIRNRDNAMFSSPCCNYYISLKPGRIKSIEGLEVIDAMDEVLNITQIRDVGDVIKDNNSLDRVVARLHVCGKNRINLAEALVKISSTLRVIDETGNDMQLEPLTFERCIETINKSVCI